MESSKVNKIRGYTVNYSYTRFDSVIIDNRGPRFDSVIIDNRGQIERSVKIKLSVVIWVRGGKAVLSAYESRVND
ncbi:unnamed protein product [Toxocara canis]|uniref:Conserved domain protein n=1 Tax=Toxocara canis TaxID=6265 RepID=A0A183V0P3_TOXCA|nr:unnamed protein product [Toxocara canis]